MSLRGTSSYRKVYYHQYRWFYVLAGTGLLAAALWKLATAHASALVLLLVLEAVFAFAMGGILRIETSAQGISYHNLGFYTIQASWNNVARIGPVPMRFVGEIRCVILHEPAAQGWTGLALSLPAGERGRTIPLSGWAHRDELEADIRRFTGHDGR